jgi:hypothetical protein
MRIGPDCDDISLMIECLGSARKRVNTQAQRGRMSKEAKARTMDRWGQSLTYVASHHPREIERSTDTKKGYRRGARFSRADCEPGSTSMESERDCEIRRGLEENRT